MSILRLLLDSWHQNEFESGLEPWFQVSVDPACKMRQSCDYQFIDRLEKRNFLQTTSNINILYTIGKKKNSTSMNSRSLSQNKAPFGSDPLAKFAIFARKNAPTIRVLSWGKECTILNRKVRRNLMEPRNSGESGQRMVFRCRDPAIPPLGYTRRHRQARPRGFGTIWAHLAGVWLEKLDHGTGFAKGERERFRGRNGTGELEIEAARRKGRRGCGGEASGSFTGALLNVEQREGEIRGVEGGGESFPLSPPFIRPYTWLFKKKKKQFLPPIVLKFHSKFCF